jgi:hypothetical protein
LRFRNDTKWHALIGRQTDLHYVTQICTLSLLQYKITVFKGVGKTYAGWNLEATECGLAHPPVGDMDALLESSDPDNQTVVGGGETHAVSIMWG